MARQRKFPAACILARAEDKGRRPPLEQWIRPVALAGQSASKEPGEPLLRPAPCPALGAQRRNPPRSAPWLGISRGRQAEEGGHAAQLLAKGDAFKLEKREADQAPCSVPSKESRPAPRHPSGAQEGRDAALTASPLGASRSILPQNTETGKPMRTGLSGATRVQESSSSVGTAVLGAAGKPSTPESTGHCPETRGCLARRAALAPTCRD